MFSLKEKWLFKKNLWVWLGLLLLWAKLARFVCMCCFIRKFMVLGGKKILWCIGFLDVNFFSVWFERNFFGKEFFDLGSSSLVMGLWVYFLYLWVWFTRGFNVECVRIFYVKIDYECWPVGFVLIWWRTWSSCSEEEEEHEDY